MAFSGLVMDLLDINEAFLGIPIFINVPYDDRELIDVGDIRRCISDNREHFSIVDLSNDSVWNIFCQQG